MTMTSDAIRNLDDGAVLRVLSALTEDMQANLPASSQKIASMDDARDAVNALLTQDGASDSPDVDKLGSDQARTLLAVLAADPTTRDQVAELLANPPDDEQRSVELALAAAVVLGGLITWLQTKFEIEINRADGKTSFRFSARKDAVDKELIADTVKSVTKLV